MSRCRRTDKIIYKVTCKTTNKVYVWFCVDFNERKARHLRSAVTGVNTRFYNAIRKYGEDSFTWEIIEKNKAGSLQELKESEKHYIKLFNSYEAGYNATHGGDGGFTGLNSGVFKKGHVPWCTGIKLSVSHVDNLKKADRSRSFKPVTQLDLSGNALAEFDSILSASIKTKISEQIIGRVCSLDEKNKHYKTAGGFKWQFKK